MTGVNATSGALVVVVEDDNSIGGAIRDALIGHGHRVEWCRDGASATEVLRRGAPDLLLLDAGLPDVDGFTLCRRIREQYRELPILLVTARDSEIDIVVGLDSGANDYVTKPFSMNVLLARVRAHLRSVDDFDPMAVIEVGLLCIEPAAYLASLDGTTLDLRPREFELLLALCRDAGRVMTRERLLSEVWNRDRDSSTKALDMNVLALRRKLGDSVEIATVRGVGYRLVVP